MWGVQMVAEWFMGWASQPDRRGMELGRLSDGFLGAGAGGAYQLFGRVRTGVGGLGVVCDSCTNTDAVCSNGTTRQCNERPPLPTLFSRPLMTAQIVMIATMKEFALYIITM